MTRSRVQPVCQVIQIWIHILPNGGSAAEPSAMSRWVDPAEGSERAGLQRGRGSGGARDTSRALVAPATWPTGSPERMLLGVSSPATMQVSFRVHYRRT